MSSLMKSLLVSAAAAGVSYYLRNRHSLRGAASAAVDRGVKVYDNHPVAE